MDNNLDNVASSVFVSTTRREGLDPFRGVFLPLCAASTLTLRLESISHSSELAVKILLQICISVFWPQISVAAGVKRFDLKYSHLNKSHFLVYFSHASRAYRP